MTSTPQTLLQEAVSRIMDMLQGDDGQAFKEARKFIDRLRAAALQAAPPAPAAVAVPELRLSDEQIEQAFISARDEFMLREVERTDKKLRLAFGRAVLHSARAALAAAPAQEHATLLAGQGSEQDDGLAQAIGERDTAEGWADGLAGLIGAYFGQDIGEHSSAHNPWQEAKDIIEEAEPYRSAAAAPAQAQEDAPDAERFRAMANAAITEDAAFGECLERLGGDCKTIDDIRAVFDAARAAQGGAA